MKCPNCKKEGCEYIEKRRKPGSLNKSENKSFASKRNNFNAKCKKCGWKGVI